MSRIRKQPGTPEPGTPSDYEQSMREFREVLARAGHSVVFRLKHPRFIQDEQDSKPRRKKH